MKDAFRCALDHGYDVPVIQAGNDKDAGFRAFRTALLRDPRIDWRQAWLDRYELEPYLLVKAIVLGYRHREVPVTKIYPERAPGYTKMRPLVDWWSILRPVVCLALRIRR